MTPRLTIAVQCHNFQRRFNWMMSSLAQQTKTDLVFVLVAHVMGNGKPTTEHVCSQFLGRVAYSLQPYPNITEFQYRGLIRNRQLTECPTEWLMFGDCDMVYHPEYFERLLVLLDEQHRNAPYMLSSGRRSQPPEQKDLTNALVDSSDCFEEIPNAFEQAATLPAKHMPNVGAGFCQLINVKHCPHGGYYVNPEENYDWGWHRGSNPKSDMQFRWRMNELGMKRHQLPRWLSRNAIHLNHDRDPEAGKHLETQR
jgi:hypothetical protein